MKGYLTQKELADAAGVTVQTITNWRASGLVPVPDLTTGRLGGKPYWKPESVAHLINSEDKKQ